jgi:G3E family GTPase
LRAIIIETTGLADPVPVLATLMFDRILQNHFAVGR